MGGAIFGKFWTDDEDRVMRDLWKTHDNQAIAKQLGRTRNAIESHGRRKLGLFRMDRTGASSTWSAAEDNLLRQLWPRQEVAMREMARQLNRTRNAVIGRAHRLQLPLRGRRKVTEQNPEQKRKLLKRAARPKHRSFSLLAPRQSVPPTLIPDDAYVPGSGVSILDVKRDQCRAVVHSSHDNEGLAVYCGAPKSPWTNYSFCEYHRQRYTQPRVR